ncbi:translation initiation factor 2 [Ureibacillus sp. NPDC094379]
MGDEKNPFNQSSESVDLFVAKLAFIGASISTLGDGLQAVAAGIALEALEREKSNNKSSQNNNGQSEQLELMQKQMDYLVNELKQVKKMLWS